MDGRAWEPVEQSTYAGLLLASLSSLVALGVAVGAVTGGASSVSCGDESPLSREASEAGQMEAVLLYVTFYFLATAFALIAILVNSQSGELRLPRWVADSYQLLALIGLTSWLTKTVDAAFQCRSLYATVLSVINLLQIAIFVTDRALISSERRFTLTGGAQALAGRRR